MEEIKENRPFSYSASNLLLTCEYKYLLHYILKTPKDPDAEEDFKAFRFGKAVHETLEISQHRPSLFNVNIFKEVCAKHTIDTEDIPKVQACVQSYYKLHDASKLDAVGFEIQIGNNDIIGYIDVVLADVNGNWWLGDIKTSGMIVAQLFSRLHLDPQLNLYSAFAWQVAEKLNLKLENFAGTRYRVISKPRTANIKELPISYDIEIPVDTMNYSGAVSKMLRLKAKGLGLTKETAEKNMQSCLSYNRPCEYWSQCYGGTFTECSNKVKIFTHANMIDRTMPTKHIEDLLM